MVASSQLGLWHARKARNIPPNEEIDTMSEQTPTKAEIELQADAIVTQGDRTFVVVNPSLGNWGVWETTGDEATPIGGSISRAGIDGIIQGQVSGESQKKADAFFAQMDEGIAEADKTVGPVLRAANFEPQHTGGGCMAWQHNLDETGDAYVMITNEDLELDGDPAATDWCVGRYQGEGWIAVNDLTLDEALGLADLIPVPTDDQELSIDGKAAFETWLSATPAPAPSI
jgi:hypothetical protein